MITREEEERRILATANRLRTDCNAVKKYFRPKDRRTKLPEYMIEFYSDIIAYEWSTLDAWKGKPPWRKGRWKTRGGRDQDRWRKIESRIRLRKWMRPMLFVNGLEVEYETLKVKQHKQQVDRVRGDSAFPVTTFSATLTDFTDCFAYAMSGTLTLGNNPDCDFVKGGE